MASLLLATQLRIPLLSLSPSWLPLPSYSFYNGSIELEFLYTLSVQFLTTNGQLPSLSLSPSISQEKESDLPNSLNPSPNILSDPAIIQLQVIKTWLRLAGQRGNVLSPITGSSEEGQPLELVDWRVSSVIRNAEFSASLHSAILGIGFTLSKIATAIPGITSRHNDIQKKKWPFLPMVFS